MIDTILALCAGAALFSLLCRLDGMTWRTHRPAVVLAHVLMAVAVIVAGWDAASDGAGVLSALVILLSCAWLLWSWPEWAGGPPRSTESRPMPLDGVEA